MSTARCAMNTLIQTIEEGEDFVAEDREEWLVLEEVDGVTFGRQLQTFETF
jgi:hypothetical protein